MEHTCCLTIVRTQTSAANSANRTKKSAEIREISGKGIVHSKLCGTAFYSFRIYKSRCFNLEYIE